MQTKRYARLSEATVAAGATSRVDIDNVAERRANWHGIRYQGRLRADNASADNEAHGIILLVCIPGQLSTLVETNVDSDSELENKSGIIIAIIPWAVFGGSTNPVGEGTLFDWNMVIKTSRTCSKGDELQGYVISFSESAKSIIISNSLLSCFETTL